MKHFVLIALVLLAVYVMTYLLAVKPATMVAISGPGPWPRMPEYRFGEWSWTVYEPILRLDRWLFPGRWQVTRAEVEKSTRRPGTP